MPSRSTRLAWGLLACLVLVFVVLVAVLTPWDPLPGASIRRAPVSVYFTPQQIRRSEAFFDASKWPAWLGLLVSVGTAVALGFTPIGRRLVEQVRRRFRPWWLQVAALVVAVTLAERLVTLPFSAWGRAVSLDYKLSTDRWSSWALDVAKAWSITVALTAIALLLLVGLARRLPRSWFIPAAAGAAALVLGLSFLYPLVVEPVFNRFTPMHEGRLKTDLLALAADDHIKVSDVLVADASRRTSALNAYVSGFGSTKRIVVYDTLLKSAPDREVELIVAHELGHAKRDDVLVGTVEGAIAAAIGVVALYLVLKPRTLRKAAGAGSVGDPAIVPVVLALTTLISLAGSPVVNTISRHIEARADVHSLDLTRDPQAFIDMQRRIAVTNLSHLDPNPVLSFWFASHPTTLDRIGMALAWEHEHGGVTPRSPGRSGSGHWLTDR